MRNKKAQKIFCDWLGTRLGYKDMDDWYNVTQGDIFKHGGRGLLSNFNGSPSKALQSVYPEHGWIIWRFNCVPNSYWENQENRKSFFDGLSRELGFKDMDGWCNVTLDVIYKNGGR